jgi:hypothetical protein
MVQETKKIFFKRRRDNKTRYSANKIYISRAELQHTNSKILITWYTYNKKKFSFENILRDLAMLVLFRKIAVDTKKVTIPNHKNRLVHLVKSNFFMFIK